MKKTVRTVAVAVAVAIIMFAGCKKDDNPVSSNGNNGGDIMVYERGKVDSVKNGGISSGYRADTLASLDFGNSDSIIFTYSARVGFADEHYNPTIYMQTVSGGSPPISFTVSPAVWIKDGGINYYDYRVAVKSPNSICTIVMLAFRVYLQHDFMFVKNFKVYKK